MTCERRALLLHSTRVLPPVHLFTRITINIFLLLIHLTLRRDKMAAVHWRLLQSAGH